MKVGALSNGLFSGQFVRSDRSAFSETQEDLGTCN